MDIFLDGKKVENFSFVSDDQSRLEFNRIPEIFTDAVVIKFETYGVPIVTSVDIPRKSTRKCHMASESWHGAEVGNHGIKIGGVIIPTVPNSFYAMMVGNFPKLSELKYSDVRGENGSYINESVEINGESCSGILQTCLGRFGRYTARYFHGIVDESILLRHFVWYADNVSRLYSVRLPMYFGP